MKKRTALSKRTRFEIFKRDAFTCQYCGAHPPAVILHCDHIVPVAADGGAGRENLVTACEACNQGKGAVPLSSVPASLKEQAERIAESERQLQGYQAVLQSQRDRIDDEAWRVANVFVERFADDAIKKSYLSSIASFNERLGVYATLAAMETAIARLPYLGRDRVFRYFCGICWKQIGMQQEALT